jgi:hypothetical protein
MLLESIILTVADIRDYTILLSLYIYVTALLGMSFFASKVKFDDDGNLDLKNGISPRANFDWVLTALLTVFEVIIGENWNAVMYDHMRGVGYGACVYFIIVVCTGNIIMLNLFLAILLGNFDRARNSGGKKKIFDAFQTLEKQGFDINLSITYLFDDADFSKYLEEKILSVKDDPRDLERAKKKRREEAKEAGLPYESSREEKEEEKLDESNNDDYRKLSPAREGEEEISKHTEHEIRQVFLAATSGTLEMILTGERVVGEGEGTIDDDGSIKMDDKQRLKTIEILTYIKR